MRKPVVWVLQTTKVNTQSDQCLCYSLIGKCHNKTGTKRNFTILASLCSCSGWFGYDLVGNHEEGFLMSQPVII